MLYIIPTPIGNLDDITVRGLKVLQKVPTIICEDSRQTRKLLTLLEIKNQPKFIDLTRNHKFNYFPIFENLEIALKNNSDIALVSDSGNPCLSDPGFEVIDLARQIDMPYTVLPGASSIITTAVGSNLISKEFWYLGFLPIKKGRQVTMKKIAESKIPVILFESVHRLPKFLQEAKTYFSPNTRICLANDISKFYEKYFQFTVSQISEYENLIWKGEFVVVIRNY